MNRFTEPVHTLSSVIRELFEGLNDGSVILRTQAEPGARIDRAEGKRFTFHARTSDAHTNRIVVDPELLSRGPIGREPPGPRLRVLRERLGLTPYDMQTESRRIAAKYNNDEYEIPATRLNDIESHGVIPSLYRLYSLSVIYRIDMRELLVCFGLDLASFVQDVFLSEPPRSHRVTMLDGFLAKEGAGLEDIARLGGPLALFLLGQRSGPQVSYAHIGFEDLTMYPVLPPGSFVQIDESRTEVISAHSEYDRPIYFVETRRGYTCCWCALTGTTLILQPHPMSQVPARVARWPYEANIIGQVVAAVKRLDVKVTPLSPATR